MSNGKETCGCRGLCCPEQWPDHRCSLSDSIDSIPVWVVVCKDRTEESSTLVFWREDSKGYTTDLEQAGHYSQFDVDKICGDRNSYYLRSRLERSKAKRSVVDRDSFLREMEAANG